MSKAVTRSETQWREYILAPLAGAADNIIEAGRRLVEAKAALEHGAWERVCEALPFGIQKAQRLMAVAQNPVLSKTSHGTFLPTSWRTLYELSRVPEKRLERAIERGLVTPEMERSEVKLLMPPKRPTVADEEALEPANTQTPSGAPGGREGALVRAAVERYVDWLLDNDASPELLTGARAFLGLLRKYEQ